MNETNKDKTWELSAAKIHGETDETENHELNQLLENPVNQKIFLQVDDLHQTLPKASPLQKASVNNSWSNIMRYFRQKQIRTIAIISKYAAIVLLAMGAGTFININSAEPVEEVPVYSEIVAPLGHMSEMTLFDGTKVWLNSGTVLKVSNDFGTKNRDVELKGEAFFDVNRGEIPFKVHFKNKEVVVLGTSFVAEAYPDEAFCKVTLVEGTLQINDATGRFIRQLHPNQQILMPDNPAEKITTREVSTLFYESWINGNIRFKEERLADVATRLERWYNVDIRFTSEEASNIRFTGTVLKNKPIDQSLKAIGILLPIKIKYESNLDQKDVITISKIQVPMGNL
jgi:transmembrane sensor